MTNVQTDRCLIRFGIVVPYGDSRDDLDRDVLAEVEAWTGRPPLGYRNAPASSLAPAGMVRHRWLSGQSILPTLTVTAARTSVNRSTSSVALTVGYTPPGAAAGRVADSMALQALLVAALGRRVRHLAEGLDGVVTTSPRNARRR